MSRNEYLFRSRSVCAFLLVCIFLSPSVFAEGFSLSSCRGFDGSTTVNTASDSPGLSLLTLIQKPAASQKDIVQWNTALACHVCSKAETNASDVSLLNGQIFTATDISSVLGQSAPANALWTLGQQNILWSLVNAPAEKIAAAPRISDPTT
jgi:hypothetical protein